jgi:thiopeptide-type bacteriocin biosynthesis protein
MNLLTKALFNSRMKDSTTWLSAHLYYAEHWPQFLTSCIKPFVEEALQAAKIKGYFFIRYWEGGPHIRLRLKGEQNILNQEIKPKLQQHVGDYMRMYPSHRIEHKDLSGHHAWHSNNTIVYAPYHRETERYGGIQAISIAEEQFQYSSEATLDILSKTTEWDYTTALGIAIQLHLSFAFSVGMTVEDAVVFFDSIHQHWLPRAYASIHHKPGSSQHSTITKQEIIQAFDRLFKQQQHILLPFCQTFLTNLQNAEEFEENEMSNWISNTKKIYDALLILKNNNELFVPKTVYTESTNDLWTIYESYVHMTNNRLGILNQDESYLAYLLKNCLTMIKGKWNK